MDLLPTDVSLDTAKTLKQNFVSLLPEPYKSKSNAAEKALALVVWALEEVGLVPEI